MWILLRLVVSGIGFAIRYLTRQSRKLPLSSFSGISYSEQIFRSKGRVTGYRLSVPLESGVVFVLTREGGFDRWSKALGLSVEFQTGDPDFDRRVYVACDHPFFCRSLKENCKTREAVDLLLSGGFRRVWSDGKWLHASSDRVQEHSKFVPLLDTLKEGVSHAEAGMARRTSDDFAWRVLLVEALLWAMAGYAGASLLELITAPQDVHLDQSRLIWLGLGLSAVVGCGLIGLIVVFLQRSSRSHRVLWESSLLLLFSLPVFGIQGVSDVNRGGDQSPSVEMQVRVERKWTTVHRRRRGRRSVQHYASFRPESPGIPFPNRVRVTSTLYQSLPENQTIPVELGQGRLGLHYFRKINGREL